MGIPAFTLLWELPWWNNVLSKQCKIDNLGPRQQSCQILSIQHGSNLGSSKNTLRLLNLLSPIFTLTLARPNPNRGHGDWVSRKVSFLGLRRNFMWKSLKIFKFWNWNQFPRVIRLWSGKQSIYEWKETFFIFLCPTDFISIPLSWQVFKKFAISLKRKSLVSRSLTKFESGNLKEVKC